MKSDLYQIGTPNDLKIFYCIIRKLYYFHYYYALTIKKKYLLFKKKMAEYTNSNSYEILT